MVDFRGVFGFKSMMLCDLKLAQLAARQKLTKKKKWQSFTSFLFFSQRLAEKKVQQLHSSLPAQPHQH